MVPGWAWTGTVESIVEDDDDDGDRYYQVLEEFELKLEV
jgi:hypothetical protein